MIDVYDLIRGERIRQDGLALDGRIPATCAEPFSPYIKLAALLEEVGEVARALMEGDENQVRHELVQVAAVATAWLEGFDS